MLMLFRKLEGSIFVPVLGVKQRRQKHCRIHVQIDLMGQDKDRFGKQAENTNINKPAGVRQRVIQK